MTQIITASREDYLSLSVTMGEFYLSELITKLQLYYTDKLSLFKTNFTVESYSDCLICCNGKLISISISEEDGCILLTVQNSGCTLLEFDLPHIYESFWRGANAEKVAGSGLGLFICRQLMHKMNGESFAQIDNGTIYVTAVFMKC